MKWVFYRMLHQNITNGNVVAPTEVDRLSINKFNKIGLTALQLAAREGQIAVVLRLINNGAEVDLVGSSDSILTHTNDSRVQEQSQKTPFYLALENGHMLVAQILLVYGASKQQATLIADALKNKKFETVIHACEATETIKHAVMYWSIKNAKLTAESLKKLQCADTRESKQSSPNTSSSFSIVISELSEEKKSSNNNFVNRLIEFSAYLKQEHLTNDLLKSNSYLPDLQHMTAGFFSKSAYDALIKNDDHTLMTLQQLREAGRNDDDFIVYYAKASAEQQDAHAFEEKSMPLLKDLSPTQKLFYSALRFSHLKKITAFKMEEKDYYAVLKQAATKQDLCVIDTLINLIPDKKNVLLKCALQDNNHDLATSWLIMNDMDPYQFVIEHLDNKIPEDALQSIAPKDSLLQRVCSIGTRRENKMTEADRKLLKCLTQSGMPTTRILQCLHDHEPHVDLTALIKLSDANISTRCQKNKPKDFVTALLNERLQRMGYFTFAASIKHFSDINPLTQYDCPLSTIISFLDSKEQAIFMQTSRIGKKAINDFQIKLSLRKKLQYHLDVLTQCEKQLRQWMADQWCLKNAPKEYWCGVFTCAVIAIGFITMLSLLNEPGQFVGGIIGAPVLVFAIAFVGHDTRDLINNKLPRLLQTKITELPEKIQNSVLQLPKAIKDGLELTEINGQSTIEFVLNKMTPVKLLKSEMLNQLPRELKNVRQSDTLNVPDNNPNKQVVVSLNGYSSLGTDDNELKETKEVTINVDLTSNSNNYTTNKNTYFYFGNASNSSNDTDLEDPRDLQLLSESTNGNKTTHS